MAIVHQAPDAILHNARIALLGDMWGDHVYVKHAPAKVFEYAGLWVVCRVAPSGGTNDYRGDRESLTHDLSVQAVSKESMPGELASARIHHLLQLSGVNDSRRPNISIGTHSEWEFLSVRAVRPIRLVPNKEYGVRFYETGYVFEVNMEAKDGYS